MITSAQCLKKFGEPDINFERKHMVLLRLDSYRELIPALPAKVYCNRIMEKPLLTALNNIVDRGMTSEFKTWDGCFNVRKKRGAGSMSLHSWGIAIDINAAWNGFGKTPTMRRDFVKCFTDAGFDWGGTWTKPDGMHFQLAKL